jgi:hypothetical protein
MAFTDDPTLARDRIRLTIGDTDSVSPYVTDAWYDYYLNLNNGNEKTTAIDVAKKILAMYTGWTRQREGQIELYGQEAFDNYLRWLKDLLSDPALGLLSAPMPYLGGSSKIDMRSNDAVSDNVRPAITSSTIGCDNGYATLADPFKLSR